MILALVLMFYAEFGLVGTMVVRALLWGAASGPAVFAGIVLVGGSAIRRALPSGRRVEAPPPPDALLARVIVSGIALSLQVLALCVQLGVA